MEEENKIVEAEQQVEGKQDNKEGRALKKWSLFFFIFCCIALIMVGSTFALPVVIILFGILSTILWLVFVLAVSIFTIGMFWTIDDAKAFNRGWMNFNSSLFSAGEVIFDKALSAVPYLIGGGSLFYLMAWLFIIIGLCKDKNRKKFYKGMMIALAILTVAYIAMSIITLIANNNK